MKFNLKVFSAIGLFLCLGDAFSMQTSVLSGHKDAGFKRLSEVKSGVRYNSCTNVANKNKDQQIENELKLKDYLLDAISSEKDPSERDFLKRRLEECNRQINLLIDNNSEKELKSGKKSEDELRDCLLQMISSEKNKEQKAYLTQQLEEYDRQLTIEKTLGIGERLVDAFFQEQNSENIDKIKNWMKEAKAVKNSGQSSVEKQLEEHIALANDLIGSWKSSIDSTRDNRKRVRSSDNSQSHGRVEKSLKLGTKSFKKIPVKIENNAAVSVNSSENVKVKKTENSSKIKLNDSVEKPKSTKKLAENPKKAEESQNKISTVYNQSAWLDNKQVQFLIDIDRSVEDIQNRRLKRIDRGSVWNGYYNQCSMCSLVLNSAEEKSIPLSVRQEAHSKGGLYADDKESWDKIANAIKHRILVYEYQAGYIFGFYEYGKEYAGNGETKRICREGGHYKELKLEP